MSTLPAGDVLSAAQAVHDSLSVAVCVPAGHFPEHFSLVKPVTPVAPKYPAAQLEQDVAPANEYVPAAHAVHPDKEVAPEDEVVPAGHLAQTLVSVLVLEEAPVTA